MSFFQNLLRNRSSDTPSPPNIRDMNIHSNRRRRGARRVRTVASDDSNDSDDSIPRPPAIPRVFNARSGSSSNRNRRSGNSSSRRRNTRRSRSSREDDNDIPPPPTVDFNRRLRDVVVPEPPGSIREMDRTRRDTEVRNLRRRVMEMEKEKNEVVGEMSMMFEEIERLRIENERLLKEAEKREKELEPGRRIVRETGLDIDWDQVYGMTKIRKLVKMKNLEDLEKKMKMVEKLKDDLIEGDEYKDLTEFKDFYKKNLKREKDVLEELETLKNLQNKKCLNIFINEFKILDENKQKNETFFNKNIEKILKWENKLKKKWEETEKIEKIFNNFEKEFAKVKSSLVDIKKMENTLIIQEDELTESQENKILLNIKNKKENIMILKRNCENFNRQILDIDDSKVFKFYKKYYLKKCSDLQSGKKRKRTLIDVFKSKNVFVVNRNLEDYSDLTLIYSNNENRIFKGKLKGAVNGGNGNSNFIILKILPFYKSNEKLVYNEVMTMIKLSHPFIININCVFQFKQYNKNFLAFEMDYFEMDLLHWLKNVKQEADENIMDVMKLDNYRSLEEIKDVTKQIMQALYYIHSKGIIHRDLKPSNILITKNNSIRIIDFGISKNQNSVFFTTVGNRINEFSTPRYRAPEGVDQKWNKISQSYDIYSFGIILYECLVKPKDVDFISLDHLPNYLEKDQIDLLRKVLNQDPEKRLNAIQVLNHEFFGYNEIKELKSQILDPKMKIIFIQNFLKSLTGGYTDSYNTIQMRVNRGQDITEEFLNKFTTINTFSFLSRKFNVKFYNSGELESGIDQGGLSNELIDIFSEQFCKKYCIKESEYDDVYLPVDKKIGNNDTLMFTNFGKFLLRIVLDEENTLKIQFADFFYLVLLEKEPKSIKQWLELSENFDKEYTKSMEKVLEERDENILKYFTFEDKDGNDIEVTLENKEEFVIWNLRNKLYGERKEKYRIKNLEAIRNGFFSFFKNDSKKTFQILSEKDLRLFIFGSNEITWKMFVDQLEFNEYDWGSYPDEIRVRKYFMKWIKTKNSDELREILYFMTALRNLPMSGKLTKKIVITPSNRFFAHTCITVREVEIKKNFQKYEDFKREIEMVVNNVKLSGMYE